MTDDLIRRLSVGGIHPTPSELLDALWLVEHLPSSSFARPHRPPNRPVKSPITRAQQRVNKSDGSAPAPNLQDLPASTSSDAPLYPAGSGQSAVLRRGKGIRAPSVPALRDPLELARALRAFGRRADSAHYFEVDDEATAAQIADEDLWTVVLRPERERWLSVALLVDTAPSMAVWEDTVSEFNRMLLWTGLFRVVTRHPFDGATSSDPLSDRPINRQLILVVTDGVDTPWHNGQASQALQRWGQFRPTAVLTVLPRRMWSGTGLHTVRAEAAVPERGAPNFKWRIWASSSLDTIAVPVFELAPWGLRNWSAVTTIGPATHPLRVLAARRQSTVAPLQITRTAMEAVAHFRAAVSPTAFRLACCFSTVPLTPPIMRLVQHTMLPTSEVAHLAEVMLSGVLEPYSPEGDRHPDSLAYDFLPGVRDALRDHMTRADAFLIEQRVGRYVNEMLGGHVDFRAVLADPAGALIGTAGGDDAPPFARVARDLLAHLPGGFEATNELQEALDWLARARSHRRALLMFDPAVGADVIEHALRRRSRNYRASPTVLVCVDIAKAELDALAAEIRSLNMQTSSEEALRIGGAWTEQSEVEFDGLHEAALLAFLTAQPHMHEVDVVTSAVRFVVVLECGNGPEEFSILDQYIGSIAFDHRLTEFSPIPTNQRPPGNRSLAFTVPRLAATLPTFIERVRTTVVEHNSKFADRLDLRLVVHLGRLDISAHGVFGTPIKNAALILNSISTLHAPRSATGGMLIAITDAAFGAIHSSSPEWVTREFGNFPRQEVLTEYGTQSIRLHVVEPPKRYETSPNTPASKPVSSDLRNGPVLYAPPRAPTQVKLGLWGPPGSGKTTFLAALKIAALRSKLPGNWVMSGSDPASSEFLAESTHQLVQQKIFPAATHRQHHMMFKFTGERLIEPPPPAPKRRWRRRSAESQMPIPTVERDQFYIDVLDTPGGNYDSRTDRLDDDLLDLEFSDDDPMKEGSFSYLDGADDDRTRLLDHLQSCQGIIYFFDADRDTRHGDSFSYLYPVLEQLTARVMESGYTGTRLPHHVAVCITKFDNPTVYKAAYVGGFASRDVNPPFAPVVRPDQAREFFRKLCRGGHESSGLVYEGLTTYFYPDNIEFFATSAVGFHAPDGLFRAQDPFNVLRSPDDGSARIRAKVHPINVLEPLLWLNEKLRSQI